MCYEVDDAVELKFYGAYRKKRTFAEIQYTNLGMCFIMGIDLILCYLCYASMKSDEDEERDSDTERSAKVYTVNIV